MHQADVVVQSQLVRLFTEHSSVLTHPVPGHGGIIIPDLCFLFVLFADNDVILFKLESYSAAVIGPCG